MESTEEIISTTAFILEDDMPPSPEFLTPVEERSEVDPEEERSEFEFDEGQFDDAVSEFDKVSRRGSVWDLEKASRRGSIMDLQKASKRRSVLDLEKVLERVSIVELESALEQVTVLELQTKSKTDSVLEGDTIFEKVTVFELEEEKKDTVEFETASKKDSVLDPASPMLEQLPKPEKPDLKIDEDVKGLNGSSSSHTLIATASQEQKEKEPAGNGDSDLEKGIPPREPQDAENENKGKQYPGGLAVGLITLGICLSVFLVSLDRTIVTTVQMSFIDMFNDLHLTMHNRQFRKLPMIFTPQTQ